MISAYALSKAKSRVAVVPGVRGFSVSVAFGRDDYHLTSPFRLQADAETRAEEIVLDLAALLEETIEDAGPMPHPISLDQTDRG